VGLRGLPERGDDVPQSRIGKPKRRLSPQHADFAIDFRGSTALACHNQDDPCTFALRAAQEIMNCLMRVGNATAVQIDPRIDPQPSFRQVSLLPSVYGAEWA